MDRVNIAANGPFQGGLRLTRNGKHVHHDSDTRRAKDENRLLEKYRASTDEWVVWGQEWSDLIRIDAGVDLIKSGIDDLIKSAQVAQVRGSRRAERGDPSAKKTAN